MEISIQGILFIFLIYSFIGWVLESVLKTILEKKPVNSGFLHGPFCPIYGMGAIIMYTGLGWLKSQPVLVFIGGFIILSVWEYFVGWALEKLFNTKYWDYSANKFNIKGRVCLLNSFYWGVLGTIFIYVVNPFVMSKVSQIPDIIKIIIFIVSYIYLIIDAVISIIKVKNITIKVRKVEELGEIIKEKIENLEKLKNTAIEERQNSIESLQIIIDDLKLKQNKIRIKLYRHVARLKRAFPTMKSEIISEILNDRIKIIKRKRKKDTKE